METIFYGAVIFVSGIGLAMLYILWNARHSPVIFIVLLAIYGGVTMMSWWWIKPMFSVFFADLGLTD